MGHKKSNLCFILFFTSLVHCLAESLDTILHDHALRVMSQQRQRSNKLYNARLPNYLAGMKVSAVELRSRTLWRKGANFSSFLIPPMTLPRPYVKRVLIVYHNLGNCSSSYYSLSGYTLLTPVVGFLVYDASSKNLSNVELNTNGKTISVSFNSNSSGNEGAKCAAFGPLGDVFLSDPSSPNSCHSNSQGHFSIVTPINKRHKTPVFWILGFVAGFTGLILGTIMGVRCLVCMRSEEEMEREADEGEFLKTYWIGSSKMPRAQVTRTQPVLESKFHPNPKMSLYA